MPTVADVVGVVLGALPQVATFEGDAILAAQTGVQLYHVLRGIFGNDVLPDKTETEIAALAAQSWEPLLKHLQDERDALNQSPQP